MRQWLQARQDGVSAARQQYQFSNVLVASEVNLVLTSLQSGFPNIIETVIPYVSLDLISYSSYDTMCAGYFLPALNFIASHHNRTSHSPPVGVYIGEFGLPLQLRPDSVVQDCMQNVVTTALGDFNAPWVMHWEVYDNEVRNVRLWCSNNTDYSNTFDLRCVPSLFPWNLWP